MDNSYLKNMIIETMDCNEGKSDIDRKREILSQFSIKELKNEIKRRQRERRLL